jgi:hypothetical protein
MRCAVHRSEFQLRFFPWLLEVLLWKRRRWIGTRACLHRFVLFVSLARLAAFFAIDPRLDFALFIRDLFRIRRKAVFP